MCVWGVGEMGWCDLVHDVHGCVCGVEVHGVNWLFFGLKITNGWGW